MLARRSTRGNEKKGERGKHLWQHLKAQLNQSNLSIKQKAIVVSRVRYSFFKFITPNMTTADE